MVVQGPNLLNDAQGICSVVSAFRSVRLLVTLLIAGFSAPLFAAEQLPFPQRSDSYFAKIEQQFSTIADAPTVNDIHISPVNSYFFSLLKRNQVFYSLLRTNSKGVVINEVTRMEKPSKKFRGIATQSWFRDLKSGKRDSFHGFLKGETGRYYLFWAEPLRKGKVFKGVLGVKIDLWDCFYRLTTVSDPPFLVKIGQMSFFSNNWKSHTGWEDIALTIPGLENRVIVRMDSVKQVAVAPVDSISAKMKSDTVPVAGPVFAIDSPSLTSDVVSQSPISKFIPGKNALLVIGIILIIVLLILLFIASHSINNWLLKRRIDNEGRSGRF